MESAKSILQDIVKDMSFTDIAGRDINKLQDTIDYCVKIAYELIIQVFNKKYYPLMNDNQFQYLLSHYIAYVCCNLLYPYCKDKTYIHKLQNKLLKIIEEYAVQECLIYITTDTSSPFQQMINYLLETFFNMF